MAQARPGSVGVPASFTTARILTVLISSPYTGIGGGGTISIVFTYPGNGISPFLANSISPGNDQITFAPFKPGTTGSIAVSLQENIGAKVMFITDNFNFHFTINILPAPESLRNHVASDK